MEKAHVALLALHVFSLLFWVGSLVSITRVLSAGDGEPEAVRARLAATARKIYRSVASPWPTTRAATSALATSRRASSTASLRW